MIAKITGILDSINLTDIIVDINGIGYEIIIPLSTYDRLPREKEKIQLFTYLHVREDAMTLYGFATEQEKELYKILTTVSGIGPKLALKILSSITISSFCEAVSNADIKMLSRINGLGKRSAERLVVELKDKITTFAPELEYKKNTDSKNISVQEEEAILALVQLGFKYETARKTVAKITGKMSSEEANSENIIRHALQSLNS